MSRRLGVFLGMAAAALIAGQASAAELKIGVAAEPSSIDPHYHNLGPNNSIADQIFEALIGQDEHQKLYPLLATDWKATDPTTWEFHLRKGVKFHDGNDFTAKDFVYTACRVPNVPNSPSSFAIFTKSIAGIQTPDPYTLIVKTFKPYPLLPVDLSQVWIISAKTNGVTGDISFAPKGCTGIAEYPKTEDFNNGKIAKGTGPFKLGEFIPGDRLVLLRNDNYWGEKVEWDKVTFKPITSDGPRVAALLAGDVDFIEKPPVQDLPRLKADPKVGLSQGLSNRIIYLHMDQYGPSTPGVTGTGKPDSKYVGDGPCATRACEKNPFLDRRVREALSKAIDRNAIVSKIMGGVAVAAGELLPKGFFGAAGLAPEKYDPEGAKKLLAEAGYPNGFNLVIGSPNDRYINDAKISQAVAQMLTKVGIKTTVNAMTKGVFFSTRNKYEFSVYLAGWGAGTGEMSDPLRALVATPNKAKGMGGTNKGRYSNPKLDALIEKALSTVDDGQREKLLQDASRMAMADYAILPLHFEVTTWAHRKGLTYKARADQHTLATGIHSVK